MSCEPEDKNHPETTKAESTDTTDEQSSAGANEKVDWQKPQTWPKEVGGSQGPEPTRYGDWENNGRCTDF